MQEKNSQVSLIKRLRKIKKTTNNLTNNKQQKYYPHQLVLFIKKK